MQGAFRNVDKDLDTVQGRHRETHIRRCLSVSWESSSGLSASTNAPSYIVTFCAAIGQPQGIKVALARFMQLCNQQFRLLLRQRKALLLSTATIPIVSTLCRKWHIPTVASHIRVQQSEAWLHTEIRFAIWGKEPCSRDNSSVSQA